jgi:chaperonin GroES
LIARSANRHRDLKPLETDWPFNPAARSKEKEKMKLRPLHDRILVKRVEEEQTTKGGIIIPDSAKEKPAEAKVMAVGNGRTGDDGKVVPLEVKKGDRVLFGKYSGTEVKIDGEEYLILREDDVLGILD